MFPLFKIFPTDLLLHDARVIVFIKIIPPSSSILSQNSSLSNIPRGSNWLPIIIHSLAYKLLPAKKLNKLSGAYLSPIITQHWVFYNLNAGGSYSLAERGARAVSSLTPRGERSYENTGSPNQVR